MIRIFAWNVIARGHICVLIVRVQNCENEYKKRPLKNLNVYLSNKFQGQLSN